MLEDPRADVVTRQYQRWVYPEPIEDLAAWSEYNWQWFDPRHAQRVLWPAREYRAELNILIAGCGTNQAAVFAYSNPSARVLAVDVSAPSLAHEQHLKDQYGLANLELQLLPIEALPTLRREFDLVVSTGVLHHLASPEVGMQALARCVRPDGVIAVMLYARYGRLGVEMLEGAFRDLGLRQDEASLALVQQALAGLADDHPVKAYIRSAPDLPAPAAVVDTFLHGRERSYTVDECQALVASAGLAFQGWLFNAPYHAHPLADPGNAFLARVDGLPDTQAWSVMERIHARNACHFFMACRSERPPGDYRIDFATDACMEYVPAFRMRCGVADGKIHRPGWSMALDLAQLACVREVDGGKTLRQIAAAATHAGAISEDAEAYVRGLFRALWRFDFVAMALR